MEALLFLPLAFASPLCPALAQTSAVDADQN